DGAVSRARLREAELEARVELEPHETRFRHEQWESAVGCSGTIRAVASVCQAAGWCEHGITRDALAELRARLVEAGNVRDAKLKDLREDRVPVFAGGVAVLGALFDALGVESMDVSDMALREGLLYDLVGRFRHEDARHRTVRGLVRRYRIDVKQGARVEATARRCFGQVAESWEIAGDENLRMLMWAGRLHELGLAVSHSQYHKHGAYVLENADMAGFSRQDQVLLAALVRGHRRKFPVAVMEALPGRSSVVARRLCVLLRLAVLLHRGRSAARPPRLALAAAGDALTVRLPRGWLDAHPLTGADLEHEQAYLGSAGIELRIT
ncbi:MAG: exopolyphosphatase, partial [Gammaproteobacteria bacterium]|nr:exopolyphosphatase [Gammaproteobacteria bacterium]